MENRCLILDANHRLSFETRAVPRAQAGQVVVKIAANGICGSDVHFFREGRLGNFVVSRPYIPGHEASGVICEVGAGVTGFQDGDRVVVEPGVACGFCEYCKSGRYNLCPDVVFLSAPPIDGTFCDYVAIDAHFVFPIPAALGLEEAALVEPAAVAVHAVNRARFANGASGAIVGAGPIGLFALQAFKAAGGGRAVVLDVLDSRLQTAKELGADEVINTRACQEAPHDLADVVFETAGNNAATETLFALARPAGKVVQVGWTNTPVVPMDIAKLMEKEIDYVGVNRYANAYPAALQYLADGRIDAKKFITQRFPFDRADQAFEFARDNPEKAVKVLVVN